MLPKSTLNMRVEDDRRTSLTNSLSECPMSDSTNRRSPSDTNQLRFSSGNPQFGTPPIFVSSNGFFPPPVLGTGVFHGEASSYRSLAIPSIDSNVPRLESMNHFGSPEQQDSIINRPRSIDHRRKRKALHGGGKNKFSPVELNSASTLQPSDSWDYHETVPSLQSQNGVLSSENVCMDAEYSPLKMDYHFYKKLPAMMNYALMSTEIFKAIEAMGTSQKGFHSTLKKVPFGKFLLYLTMDSLYNNDWDEYDTSEINFFDIESKTIHFKNGQTRSHYISDIFDIVDDNCPTLQNSPLDLSFSEFQFVLYKLVVPNLSNCDEQLSREAIPSFRSDMVKFSKRANNFFYEFASSNMRHLQARLNFYESPVSLKMNRKLFIRVLQYSLPLYMATMLTLHETIHNMTKIMNLLPLPDYIRLRLAYEITGNLYWFAMATVKSNSLKSSVLEDATRHLWLGINKILVCTPKQSYFVSLREDLKVLLLLHMVLAEIRFSFTFGSNRNV